MYFPAPHLLSIAATILEPPLRRRVSESARAVVRTQSASGAVRSWDPAETPYMVEPMDRLEDRRKQALVFIGPAQSGQSMAVGDCYLAHIATCSPSDTMMILATQKIARDFERDRWRKLKRLSPQFAGCLSAHAHDDNTHDKTLATGDLIYLHWPSENNIQGKSIRRMILPDYDRAPLSIGSQGSLFELSRKRTRRYRSLAMTLAESSPGHEQTDAKWRPVTPHDAPPAKGIFSLYRLGDRHRLYWPCPHCGEYFMSPPGIDGFQYDVQRDLLGQVIPETLGEVTIGCPRCSQVITSSQRPRMLAACRWVPDHCEIDRHGTLTGTPPQTDIASYWLHGVHAAYTTWRGLIYGYLQARAIADATGDEEGLRTVTMQDFAAPYLSQARAHARRPTELETRIERTLQRGIVPAAVRYLTACVDTQSRHFSVMIIGRGPGQERWIIDRFEITDSARTDLFGNPEALDPIGHPEDWDRLTERVVCAAYPLAAHPGKSMTVRLTLVDSGGGGERNAPGINVTARAYAWFRRLRAAGLAQRVALTKGTSARPGSRGQAVTETYPDTASRADRHSGARGDVPLYFLHTNSLKDQLDADLQRPDPGPGYVHFPTGLPPALFDELTAEVRTDAGWELANANNRRNEAWDQLVMELAAALLPQDHSGIVRSKEPRVRFALPANRIDWDRPPVWAGPQPTNCEIDHPITAAPAAAPRRAAAAAAAFRVF